MPSLGGWEFVILIGILVLLFGAKKLPDMARSIGQSARVFKGEMKGLKNDGTDAKTESDVKAEAPPAPAPLPPAPPVAAQPVAPAAPVTTPATATVPVHETVPAHENGARPAQSGQ